MDVSFQYQIPIHTFSACKGTNKWGKYKINPHLFLFSNESTFEATPQNYKSSKKPNNIWVFSRRRLISTFFKVKGTPYWQGIALQGHNHLILLVLRRTSNHSLNLSPIFGKRLNRSACRSYINVSSPHHRVGMFLFIAKRDIYKPWLAP